MAPPRPAVWIATTLRHFGHEEENLTPEAAFKLLPEHYRRPIEELAARPGIPWELQMMVRAGGSISRERCRFATEFMLRAKSPQDMLLMVDFDLMPTVDDYMGILSRPPELEVVGGLYSTREHCGRWVLNGMSGAVPTADGLLQVLEIGTGFKRFTKSAFDKVLLRHPWLDCESDVDPRLRLFGFFSMGPVEDRKCWPGKRRWLTEDYWFDWLCRESGIPCIADTRLKIKHLDESTGTAYPAKFPPDPGELPRERAEP